MPPPLIVFAAATLAPVPLIAAGAVWGGAWAVCALIYLTLVTAALDEAVRAVLPATKGEEFPAATALSVALALGQVAVIALIVRAVTGGWLTGWEKAALFVGAGLFVGQVGNSNAHELIHRSRRGLRRLGVAAYASVLFGHHASAHTLVHHIHVATRADPSSARLGEGFWRFAPRAWFGSFRTGWRAESARLTRTGRPWWRHPYAGYAAWSLAFGAGAAAIGGAWGVAVWVALASFAQVQLLLSDYVQHYGLSREMHEGRAEPVGMAHSWNAPHAMSGAMMLNAPRHSDHHAHPARTYPALDLPGPGDAPTLPRSLPVMACLALWPRGWRRVMDPAAARWRDGARAPAGGWTQARGSGSVGG